MDYFKKLNVEKKLRYGFFSIIALFSIITIIAIIGVCGIRESFDDFYESPYNSIKVSMKMRENIKSVGGSFYKACTSDESKAEDYITSSQDEVEEVIALTDSLKESFTNDPELMDEFNDLAADEAPVRQELISKVNLGRQDEALELYTNEYMVLLDKESDILQKIEVVASQASDSFYSKSNRNSKIISYAIILILVITIVLSIYISRMITKSIVIPVEQILHASDEISNGNLDIDIEYDSEDELGLLAKSMRKTIQTLKEYIYNMSEALSRVSNGDMTAKIEMEYVGDFAEIKNSINNITYSLSLMISKINSSANEIASTSSQISDVANNLAEGSTEQSIAIDELMKNINNISTEINKTVENIDMSKSLSEKSQEMVNDGLKHINDILEAMNNISKSSDEINQFIENINEIAAQTKLLALNASIEASRAGDAGKGFAVVACEVEKLAVSSSEASRRIEELVNVTMNTVKDGKEKVDNASCSFTNIVNNTYKTNKLINYISDSANEQANVIGDFAKGIEQIADTVQTNSATAEESAASSSELNCNAEFLKDLVQGFIIES